MSDQQPPGGPIRGPESWFTDDDEGVGDLGETLARIVVLEGDRLVGEVARGEDDRLADVGGEQMVQGRVREHHPEVARARRDPRRDPGRGPAAPDQDRTLPA